MISKNKLSKKKSKSWKQKLIKLKSVKGAKKEKAIDKEKVTKTKATRTTKALTTAIVLSAITSLTYWSTQNVSINGHCCVDDIKIERIESKRLLIGVEIGKIYRIKEPKNLPKFENAKQAIEFVRKIPYDYWEDNPSNVLNLKRGNCLGKARLLYFIGKRNNYKFDFEKTESHITLKYGGDLIDITK